MTIDKALAGLGVPVCHPPYRGKAEQYITYSLLGQGETVYAEGRERATSVAYVVNVYSPGPGLYALMLNAKKVLEDDGWIVEADQEIYEQDVDLHRIILTAEIVGAVYG